MTMSQGFFSYSFLNSADRIVTRSAGFKTERVCRSNTERFKPRLARQPKSNWAIWVGLKPVTLNTGQFIMPMSMSIFRRQVLYLHHQRAEFSVR